MAKSNLDLVLERQVAVTMPISLWVTIQQAVINFDLTKADPRLLEDYQQDVLDIRTRLEKLFDKEWPLI
jgi:hypothetical protein